MYQQLTKAATVQFKVASRARQVLLPGVLHVRWGNLRVKT